MTTKKTLNMFALISLGLLASAFFYNTENSNISSVIIDETSPTSTAQTSNSEINSAFTNEEPTRQKPRLLVKEVTYDDYKSSLGPLAKSLRGTRIPAAFTLDTEGHLIVTPSIKSVIEYFLSATGEESLETIISLRLNINSEASAPFIELALVKVFSILMRHAETPSQCDKQAKKNPDGDLITRHHPGFLL